MGNQVIIIGVDESNNVERLFLEFHAGREIIAFLMKDKEIQYDILQEYIDIVEAKYVELELMKSELSEKYKPFNMKEYDYRFDFRNNSIIYNEM